MAYNPMFSKRSQLAREVVLDLVDMAKQQPKGKVLKVSKTKPETIATGWKEALKTMSAVLKTRGENGIVLAHGDLRLFIVPEVMARYSNGRLSPGDAFGRGVWDIMRELSKEAPDASVLKRSFSRAKAALTAFSLEVASRVGKTAKEHPSLTLRMLDHVPPTEAWVDEVTAAFLGVEDGDKIEGRRHPLPTFAQLVVRVHPNVPTGTITTSPWTAQMAWSADADGDQVVLTTGWPSGKHHAASVFTAMQGMRSLKETALVSFLNPDHKTLAQKLGYQGMLKIPVAKFVDTLYQIAEYSVTGIGQIGYNPALGIAVLGLMGEREYKQLVGFGYRRAYEDTCLAGLTPERWEVLRTCRSPENAGDVQSVFNSAGFKFDLKQASAYQVGRALGMAASQMERRGYVSPKVLEMLGSAESYINLFGVVKALDAGRLDSVFLTNWEEHLNLYPDNNLTRTLREVAPVAAAAGAQIRWQREVEAERREYGIS
jgi:hypothetical protein